MKLSDGIFKHCITAFLLTACCPMLYSQSLPKDADAIQCFKGAVPSSGFTEGDQNIDVKYYRLTLDIDYQSRNIDGSTLITFIAKVTNLSTVYINLANSLACDSVVYQNTPLPFTHTDDLVTFTLPASLGLNQQAECTIYYKGTPASTGFGSFAFGSLSSHPAMWSLSEPYGSADWWANKNSVADKADSADIIIICDTSFVAVSNGILINRNNAAGKSSWHWRTRYPIANYLISVAISQYEQYDNWFVYSAADSMPVSHFLVPDIMNQSKTQLDKTIPMLTLFTHLFGEYPFIKEKYGHAQFGRGGGMEHQTISSMSGFNDGLMAHELAHQWFGDKVTNANWSEIWLHEGFATYSEGLWYESQDASWLGEYMSIREGPAKAASGSIFVHDVANIYSIFDFNRTYAKASWVLHMLRGITGDSIFFSILKSYLNSPGLAYGNASTDDFVQIASSIYGSSLTYFFDQWIRSPGYPKYLITYSFSVTFDKLYKTKISIDQSANTGGVVFTMPIDVLLQTTAGDTLVKLQNNTVVQNFEILTTAEPKQVYIDPNEKILKEVNITRRYPENLLRDGFAVYNIWPNPASDKISIGFELIQNKKMNAKIYSLTGELVAEVVNEELPSGVYIYPVSVNGKFLSSGIYILKVTAGEKQYFQKISVVR